MIERKEGERMKEDELIWGFMIQLGHNMWREEPLYGETIRCSTFRSL